MHYGPKIDIPGLINNLNFRLKIKYSIMKKMLITPIFLFAFSLCLQAENDRDIQAEIKHVTVYPDRAQLSHESSFELTPGKTILKLKGLSPYIDAQSIQVKGIGEFTILSVNLQNNFLQNL